MSMSLFATADFWEQEWILLVVVAGLLIFLLRSSWVRFRLRHFPGPALAGYSIIPLLTWHFGGNLHVKYQHITEQYGPMVRIAPTILLTSDLAFWRQICSARSNFRRATWYRAFRFNPDRDSVISVQDNDIHAQLRAKLAPGYSGKEVVGLEEKIDDNVRSLIRLIQTSYLSTDSETKPFDLSKKIQFFTTDTIGDISFSKPIGFLEHDTDVYDYLRTSAELFPFLIIMTLFPSLMDLMCLDVVKKYLPSVSDSIGFGRLLRLAKETANSRYPPKEGESQQDMLGSFIRHGLTKEEAESETIVQILAGAETSATAIRMILFYLYANPRVLSKLRAEINEAQPSSPIGAAEAAKLPYLQAVIKEGTRIYSPTTGLMLKEVPKEGVTWQGKFIPAGTDIGLSVLGLFFDKKIFGTDADLFRPERFINGTAAELLERDMVVDAAFGNGKWKCLGKHIGMMEISKVVTEFVRTFELEIVNPTAPFKNYNAGIQLQSDMWMRATLLKGSRFQE